MDVELLRASRDIATAVGGALAAKPLLERLLGPSFEYVGQALSHLIERYGNINVWDIFQRAASKIDDRHGHRGYVHPRVLRAMIEDGSFAQDPVVREYYAGLLASSIDSGSDDDRAVTFLAILRNLTARQIQLHHIIYSYIRAAHADGIPLFAQEKWTSSIFITDLNLNKHPLSWNHVKDHLLLGLSHEGLVDPAYETHRYVWASGLSPGRYGAVFRATRAGAQLFLWVHGQPDAPPESVCDHALQLRDWSTPIIDAGVVSAAAIAQHDRVKIALIKAMDEFGVVRSERTASAHKVYRRYVREFFAAYTTISPLTGDLALLHDRLASDMHVESIRLHEALQQLELRILGPGHRPG